MYLDYNSTCTLVRFGSPPPPLSPASVPPPPGTKVGGTHSPVGEGSGGRGSQSDDWRKSLTLCLICGMRYYSASPYPPLPNYSRLLERIFKDDVNGFSSISDICFIDSYMNHSDEEKQRIPLFNIAFPVSKNII